MRAELRGSPLPAHLLRCASARATLLLVVRAACGVVTRGTNDVLVDFVRGARGGLTKLPHRRHLSVLFAAVPGGVAGERVIHVVEGSIGRVVLQ